ADHVLLQPSPRGRAVPPGADGGRAGRAPAVPNSGMDRRASGPPAAPRRARDALPQVRSAPGDLVLRVRGHVNVWPALTRHGCVAPPRSIFRYDFVVAPCPAARLLGQAVNMT